MSAHDTPDLEHERGLLLLRKSEFGEAEQCFRRVLQANPEHQVAWDRLGWTLANQRKFEEARQCVEKALSVATAKGRRYDVFRFYTTMGAIYCLAGDSEKALAVLEKADASNWYNIYWKAQALKALGRPSEALALAKEARSRAPRPLLPPLSDELAELITECEARL